MRLYKDYYKETYGKTFHNRLQYIRRKHKIEIEKLAEAVGVSSRTMVFM